jgi:ATP sulfurylase
MGALVARTYEKLSEMDEKIRIYVLDKTNLLEIQAIVRMKSGLWRFLRNLKIEEVLKFERITWDPIWHVPIMKQNVKCTQVNV